MPSLTPTFLIYTAGSASAQQPDSEQTGSELFGKTVEGPPLETWDGCLEPRQEGRSERRTACGRDGEPVRIEIEVPKLQHMRTGPPQQTDERLDLALPVGEPWQVEQVE